MPTSYKTLAETASQTAGPYVHIGLAASVAGFETASEVLGQDIAGPNALGERILVQGHVFDGAGEPIKDAVIEVWQANRAGHYAHPKGGGEVEAGFRGWGRAVSDFNTGLWSFETVKPGRVLASEFGAQAPHLNFWIVARGINIGLNTRMYFSDEVDANANDPVLSLVEEADRRTTLIGTRGEEAGKATYHFDIRVQGEGETVFFDV